MRFKTLVNASRLTWASFFGVGEIMCNRYEQALRPQALSLALLVLPLLGGAQEASALPKQGSGAGQCRCMCVAPSGVNGGSLISDNLYNSQGYACSAFEGAT